MGQKLVFEKGTKFGRLTVIEESAKRTSQGSVMWTCSCQCGKVRDFSSIGLRIGVIQSCGCLRNEKAAKRIRSLDTTTHGMSYSPTYKSWACMIQRCTNPNAHGFEFYGGRGISVCTRWRESFQDFLSDMGKRPAGTSLDRRDVNGNYDSSNCRWATAHEQRVNKRDFALEKFSDSEIADEIWRRTPEYGMSFC